MNILFICTGNTCRSPMAEGYLKAKAIKNTTVFSRGLAVDGSKVTENSMKAMAQIGIDIADHISSQITFDDIVKADKIICLGVSHKNALLNIGVSEEKLFVLGDGINDPYGCDLQVYCDCRDQITKEIDELIKIDFFSEISVIPAEESHFEEIARLEEICFSSPWSKDALLESFNMGTKFFVAQKDNRVLGYLGIKPVLDEGYITNVAVFPEFRGQGLGKALVKKVLEYAEENNFSFVTLEVRKSNERAISLYTSFGFKLEGERKNFYSNPTENGLIMTKRFE